MMDERAGRSGVPPTVSWTGSAVRIIDQRELPRRLVFLDLRSVEEVREAIRDMAVRGAPAIGCTAALGMVLLARSVHGLSEGAGWQAILEGAEVLRSARPTAVNLSWAVSRVLAAMERARSDERVQAAEREALAMLEEDVAVNRAIGEHGARLLPDGCTVLTHCNAGSLATVAYGTALGVVRSAYEMGRLKHVYADETRPRLQGMQLTAWELREEGIPVTVIPDGSAAWLMKQRRVDAVVVGADRIARNGDAANKIGTYGLAICARRHGVPFYVAAPVSTVDWNMASGDDIPIEERAVEEVTHIGGVRVAPEGIGAWNPAFDVTPGELITRIVTEYGDFAATAEGMAQLSGLVRKGGIHGSEGG